ncbi:MAG: 1-deoxy-D-xylulose-5-phosphate synthase [Candidatus Omnitrophota bacterium]|nr:1-deoxy-D-xylulose-5-phosphate synthase [Candidatus Omnitrophota bacterium]
MLLEKVNNPKELKTLSIAALTPLCAEIRKLILETVSNTGGHLASSLGAVELAVSLHYCLNTPEDILIWDVGHQAYAHKILTGRAKNFSTLRQAGGVSGFPSRTESGYDVFTTGHASTALSLALGIACAQDLSKTEKKQKVVAVIGDGSLTGGMCLEALNNTGHLQKDLLVVFNTNEMSIAPSVGALSNYLNKIISLPIYNRFRDALQDFVAKRVPRGKRLLGLAKKFEEGLKNILVPGILFEEMGFRYFGPIDGHNVELLVNTLKHLLVFKGPILLHVVTKKGKGYKPAEDNPENFHGTGKFDLATGAPVKPQEGIAYTEIFSKKIAELAGRNKKIVAISAAMPQGTGLDKFASLYPERFFDVGIAEEHAVGFAAGLAQGAFRPVVAIYSTFLQRSYDQIMEEVSLQNLPVVFAVDRAGIVGEDGATHQGIFDISYLRTIPDLVILAPKDGEEFEAMLEFAFNHNGPTAIRYPKDRVPVARNQLYPVGHRPETRNIELGRAEVLRRGKDLAIIALGSMVYPALEAAEILSKEDINVEVVNARFAKPLDKELLRDVALRFGKIIVIEEGIAEGGFGSAVKEILNNKTYIKQIGLPCEFIKQGKRRDILAKYGLDKEGIANTAREVMSYKL